MPGFGTICPEGMRAEHGRSTPRISDLDFFGDIERVVDLDAEVAHSTFYLSVAQEQLNRSQVAGAAVEVALVRRMECVAYLRGSMPIPLTHSPTRRAYWRVDRC